MATKKPTSKKDPRLAKNGLSGVNKPKRTPNHPTKSHVVLASEKGVRRLIRFGEQGAKSAAMKAKRKSFKARHGKNIAKGKLSAAYWANKEKW
jgi:hypothetical protein